MLGAGSGDVGMIDYGILSHGISPYPSQVCLHASEKNVNVRLAENNSHRYMRRFFALWATIPTAMSISCVYLRNDAFRPEKNRILDTQGRIS